MTDAGNGQEYLPGYRKNHVLHHEWRTAENSAGYLLPELKAMAERRPDLNILDVGAGSGTITAGLAKYVPGGQVTAVDLSEDILSRAQDFAKSVGVENITCRKGDVYKLPFPDSVFDFTHAHQMLMHLDTPRDALKEMMRVTRPGGVVAVRDADLTSFSCWPESPQTRRFFEILLKTHQAAGGSTTAGRQLLSWALEAGSPREKVTPGSSAWCFSTPDEKSVWSIPMAERLRDGGMRKKALELEIAKEKELEEIAKAWDEWVEIEDAIFTCMHGEILIYK